MTLNKHIITLSLIQISIVFKVYKTSVNNIYSHIIIDIIHTISIKEGDYVYIYSIYKIRERRGGDIYKTRGGGEYVWDICIYVNICKESKVIYLIIM